MPTTIKKQLIIDAFTLLMQGIHKNAGYYSDLGSKVTEWKVNPLGDNRVDGINFFEDPNTPESILRNGEDESTEEHTIILCVEITVKDAVSPATARQYEVDTRKAVGTNELFGNLATATRHISTQMDKDQQKNVIFGVTMRFQIEFNTLKFNES